MSNYRLVKSAARVPVPGGKLIQELFGRASTGTDKFSLAHMVAPGNWTEPEQTPEFGELTLQLRGRLQIEIGGETVVLEPGQALWVEPGSTVHYSNPFEEEAEYYALCLPAFTPERAGR